MGLIIKISICWDVAKLVKARGFDPRIRRFESCRPSHSFLRGESIKTRG